MLLFWVKIHKEKEKPKPVKFITPQLLRLRLRASRTITEMGAGCVSSLSEPGCHPPAVPKRPCVGQRGDGGGTGGTGQQPWPCWAVGSLQPPARCAPGCSPTQGEEAPDPPGML